MSILIPCFNAAGWVGEAIESALAQTWADKEVIVFDDGSTDSSLDVIRAFGDRIRWETGPNRGGGAARNRLLELAKGEWLQYLDADDFLLPEKVERQITFLKTAPDLDVLCSPTKYEKRGPDGLFIMESAFPEVRDPWAMLALWELPQTGGPLWRRTALARVNGWRVGQPCCQEHEVYERLLEAGCRFGFMDESLAVYRVWDFGDRLVPRHLDEIPRQRLAIIERMEAFLRANGLLTRHRRQAINDARHQIARSYWKRDPSSALQIIRRIQDSDAKYCPAPRPSSPRAYGIVYRLVGFRGAQLAADVSRRFAQRS